MILGLSRLVVAVLILAAPVNSFAQDTEISATPAPEAVIIVNNSDLAQLGKRIFEKLDPILQVRVYDEEDSPCPLENDVPKCFDADFVRRSALQPVAIAAALDSRALIIQVIESYTSLIAAVGSGEIDLAKQQATVMRDALEGVGAFGGVLGLAKGVVEAAVPIPPVLTDAGFAIIAELISRISKSQGVEEQSDALLAGAAVVEAMIAALIDETPRIYEIYRLGRKDEVITLEEELVIASLPLVEAAPESDATTNNTTGSPEETRSASDIEDEIATIKEDVRTFYRDLGTYVVLLDQRRAAIEILSEAASHLAAPKPAVGSTLTGSQLAVEQVRHSNNLLKKFKFFVRSQLN